MADTLRGFRSGRAVRYGAAVLAVIAAALLRHWLGVSLAAYPFIPFFFATLFVVAFFGPGPGAVATMGSAFTVTYCFMKPARSLEIAALDDRVRLLLFVSIGLTMSVLAEWMRRKRNAEMAAAAAQAQKAAIEASRRSEAALKDVDRRKDQFIATLAHELRNPLAAIRSATYSVAHERAAEAKSKRELDAAAIVERQLAHLIRLVDDLLEVSRIRTGNIELKTERVELTEVLRHAVETAQPAIDRGGHVFKMDVPAEPLALNADPVRLAQVFANLLENAAKYTDSGGVIWLSAVRSGDQAIVAVRDNGIGILPEALPGVFDFFAQGDRAGARAHGGLGVGLGLVKKLVELHGGTVEAHSDGVGLGSTFTVRLQLMKEAGGQRRSAEQTALLGS